MTWQLFNQDWFARHQQVLLRLLACPLVGQWLRWGLCICPTDVGYAKPIVAIYPHAYIVWNGDETVTVDVRTHWKYAKRLYFSFRLLWLTCHWWDLRIANRWAPAWNLGFDSFLAYPDAGDPGTTTCDGSVERTGVSESFSVIRAGAGTDALVTGSSGDVLSLISTATTNLYATLTRMFFGFDCSMVAVDKATAVVFSIVGTGKSNGVGSPDFHVASATPASPTTLVPGDYGQVGRTSFSSKTYAAITANDLAVTDFPFNSDGLSYAQQHSVIQLSLQLSWDLTGTFTGVWADSLQSSLNFRVADNAGLTKDPLLTLTLPVSPASAQGTFPKPSPRRL